jgi:hypothetical protein
MADYDSPEHWPPVDQLGIGFTVWPVPGRAVPEIADVRRVCLEWHGPGHPIYLNRGRHHGEDVSGPCATDAEAQAAVEAYIWGYFPPLIYPRPEAAATGPGTQSLSELAEAIRRRGDVLAKLIGQPFPNRPGHRIGACGHAVVEADWEAGQRTCHANYCIPKEAMTHG